MALAGLAEEAARREAFQEARLILARVGDRRLRDESLFTVASIAVLHHQFPAAEQVCRLLDDVAQKQELWYGLATEEALAGKCDLALEASRCYVGDRADGDRRRVELLQLIETCRQRGASKEPQRVNADLREEIFSLGGMSWMPRSEDIGTHEKRMHESSDPVERTVSSTLLARWYQGRYDMVRCRFAVTVAVETLPRIRGDYERLSRCAELAETMLRAGWSSEARGLAGKVATRDGVASALKGTDVSALPPKLAFVLIQLGKTDDAFEIARRATGLFRGDDTWWAAGIACALEGKTEEVRRRLPGLERDRDKAILAAGVALGLQELAEKGSSKP